MRLRIGKKYNTNMLQNILRQRSSGLSKPINGRNYAASGGDKDSIPFGPNDVVSPTIRNRNPMNLEKMRIGKSKSFLIRVRTNGYHYFKLNWFYLQVTNQQAFHPIKAHVNTGMLFN